MNIEIKDEEVATLKDILRLRLLYGVKNATDACAEKDFEAVETYLSEMLLTLSLETQIARASSGAAEPKKKRKYTRRASSPKPSVEEAAAVVP